jgi:hypothetical protein
MDQHARATPRMSLGTDLAINRADRQGAGNVIIRDGTHKHVAEHAIESAGTWSRTLSSFKLRIAGFDANIRIETCHQPARLLEHRHPDVDFLRRST